MIGRLSGCRREGSRFTTKRIHAFAVLAAVLCAALASQNAAAQWSFETPTRDFDFLHMRLEVTFTRADIDAQRMHGVVTYRIRPRAAAADENLSKLRLDAVDLEIEQAELGPPWRETSYEVNDNHLTINLGDMPTRTAVGMAPAESDTAAAQDSKAAAAGEFSVRIKYDVGRKARSLYFVKPDADHPERPTMIYSHSEPMQARYWLPCHDWPDTFWPSDVFITVPEPMMAVSVGAPVGEPQAAEPPPWAAIEADERLRTYHWRVEQPIDTHMFGFVVGPLHEIRFGERDDPRILAYVLPGCDELARYSFRNIPKIIDYYEELIGVDYPFPQFSHVTVANHFHGGMENIGFSMISPASLSAGERGDRPLGDTQFNYLAHMIAHIWFGGLVNYGRVEEAWLNESFGTYLHQLARIPVEGEDAFMHDMWNTARRVCVSDRVGRWPLVGSKLSTPGAVYGFGGGLIYWKGAWVLHMLRHQLGDETFWRAARTYLVRHRGGPVTTADLRQALEDVSGRDLKPFFDQWVYRAGTPRLEAEYTWDKERRQAMIEIRQKQQIDDENPPFAFPLDLHFRVSERVQNKTVEIANAKHTFEFAFDEAPSVFCIDPRNGLLKSLKQRKPSEMWLAQIRQGPTALSRSLAIERVKSAAKKGAFEPLRDALTDEAEFWGVRRRAAGVLSTAESDAALQVLLAAEQAGIEHPKLLADLVRALGRSSASREACAAVLRHAGDDQHIIVQDAALRALPKFDANVRPASTPQAIVSAALPGTSHHVRRAALRALETLEDPSVVEPLLPVLDPQEYDTIELRRNTIALIAKLAKDEPDWRARTVELLKALQKADPRPYVQSAVKRALKDLE